LDLPCPFFVVSLVFNGPAMAAGKEILTGAPNSMTGAMAADGIEQRWAYEQAVWPFTR
jgi:hypothetical protein